MPSSERGVARRGLSSGRENQVLNAERRRSWGPARRLASTELSTGPGGGPADPSGRLVDPQPRPGCARGRALRGHAGRVASSRGTGPAQPDRRSLAGAGLDLGPVPFLGQLPADRHPGGRGEGSRSCGPCQLSSGPALVFGSSDEQMLELCVTLCLSALQINIQIKQCMRELACNTR